VNNIRKNKMEENTIKCKQCKMVVPFSNFCQECGNKLPKIDKCPICFEEKTLDTTKCGHSACDSCFETWYKTNQSCPICRNVIQEVIEISDEEIDYEVHTEEQTNIQTPSNSLPTIEYTNVETSNQSNYINICNLCNSNLLTDLSQSTETEYNQSRNNNNQKIYSCQNCKNIIFSPFVISKSDYNKGSNKVKEPIHIEICTICTICNNKNFEIEFHGIDSYKTCKNCKKANPTTRVILKKNYNKGENIVQKIKLY
jgi:hypothetical protein